jgi:two-component system, OmpR family, KDP operon response regulator KdpE
LPASGVRPLPIVTILIAEDDSTTRWALAALLRAEGHQAVTVANGRAAVAAVQMVRPDLVIVDYGLPDMSGLDVVEKIAPARGRPKALIVTGQYLSRRVRDAAALLGVRIFRKPISPPEFLDFVRDAGGGLA